MTGDKEESDSVPRDQSEDSNPIQAEQPLSETERSSRRRRGIAKYEVEARDTSVSEWWEHCLRPELYTRIPSMSYIVALTADDHYCTLPTTP